MLWRTMTMLQSSSSFSFISSSMPPPSLSHHFRRSLSHNFTIKTTFPNPSKYFHHNGSTLQTLIRVSSADNQTVDVSSPTTKDDGESSSPSVDIEDSASYVVRNFYTGINNHDLASVENLIAEDCVYEDLIFPRPFVGRKAILEFFKKFIDSISKDLQFVIDDISNEDTSAVGVTWHLEWKGKLFPFSKGCSFYRLKVVNGKRQIIYGRDSVEPSIKPGETALVAIRGVTWLLQQFPQLADQL